MRQVRAGLSSLGSGGHGDDTSRSFVEEGKTKICGLSSVRAVRFLSAEMHKSGSQPDAWVRRTFRVSGTGCLNPRAWLVMYNHC